MVHLDLIWGSNYSVFLLTIVIFIIFELFPPFIVDFPHN